MQLTCPECKNQVDLTSVPQPLVKDQVVECNHCGISLLLVDVTDGSAMAEIMDEGK